MPFCTQICIDVSVIVCILGDASQLLLCWRIISYYFPEIYDAEWYITMLLYVYEVYTLCSTRFHLDSFTTESWIILGGDRGTESTTVRDGLRPITSIIFSFIMQNYIYPHLAGCGHCKKAKPEFTGAAERFADDPKVEFAAVDCTSHQALCGANDVSGYPTFKYFNYYKNTKPYNGGRTVRNFYHSSPWFPLFHYVVWWGIYAESIIDHIGLYEYFLSVVGDWRKSFLLLLKFPGLSLILIKFLKLWMNFILRKQISSSSWKTLRTHWVAQRPHPHHPHHRRSGRQYREVATSTTSPPTPSTPS